MDNKLEKETLIFKAELMSALNEVMDYLKSKNSLNITISKTYFDNILTSYFMYGEEAVKVQILYLKKSLFHWRGPIARRTKKILEKFTDDISPINDI